MKNTKNYYCIVYSEDFFEYAEDGSYNFTTYKEAKSRLSFMDNKNELEIVKITDDGYSPSFKESAMYYREGSSWVEL